MKKSLVWLALNPFFGWFRYVLENRILGTLSTTITTNRSWVRQNYSTNQSPIRNLSFFFRTSSSYLLPEFPVDQNTNWISENCSHSFKQTKIEEITKILLDEKDSIHRTDITSLKIFMKKAENQLHPHNYILSLNKRWLLPLMCSNPSKV